MPRPGFLYRESLRARVAHGRTTESGAEAFGLLRAPSVVNDGVSVIAGTLLTVSSWRLRVWPRGWLPTRRSLASKAQQPHIMPPFAVSALLLLGLLGAARAAVPADIVTSLPGFTPFPTNFKVYSGFLDVTFDPPVVGCSGACFYDGAKIHYQFHASQGDPKKDPIASWCAPGSPHS